MNESTKQFCDLNQSKKQVSIRMDISTSDLQSVSEKLAATDESKVLDVLIDLIQEKCSEIESISQSKKSAETHSQPHNRYHRRRSAPSLFDPVTSSLVRIHQSPTKVSTEVRIPSPFTFHLEATPPAPQVLGELGGYLAPITASNRGEKQGIKPDLTLSIPHKPPRPPRPAPASLVGSALSPYHQAASAHLAQRHRPDSPQRHPRDPTSPSNVARILPPELAAITDSHSWSK
eukprot:gnl/Dysnectes_brevis/2029_a2341_1687.p1 GENE.gnl/Dysnectes_brevis/2029_a2341_1687~~gnl/Dysnectes_brevis/2029_a2341_1687.p1  ORF type:complete len:232 (+),score=11.90 gnl/Dysnectes_brevis/2029_a2341_1687:181-876(+)